MQCVGCAEIKRLYAYIGTVFACCNSESQAAKQMVACTAATSTISSPTGEDTGLFSVPHKLLPGCPFGLRGDEVFLTEAYFSQVNVNAILPDNNR